MCNKSSGMAFGVESDINDGAAKMVCLHIIILVRWPAHSLKREWQKTVHERIVLLSLVIELFMSK